MEQQQNKEFTTLHINDRTIFEIVQGLAKLPMHMSMRSLFFEFIENYENRIMNLAPDITQEEEDMLKQGQYKMAIKSYSSATNFPYSIAKKVIDQEIKNLGLK